MSSELYNDIMEGLREVREIRAGRLKPASVVEIPEPPKAVRTRLKLSQAEFAEFVGVNERTGNRASAESPPPQRLFSR